MKSAFIDTNILIYSVDGKLPDKQAKAVNVLEAWNDRFWISTQVLQEFYSASTRKLGLPPHQARAMVEHLSRKRVVRPDTDLIIRAIDSSERSQISFWDALIIESAAQSGCDVLLTEDLGHGQVIRGVKIENPFK